MAQMASFPCPYCGHAVASGEAEDSLDHCPNCGGSLDIAYRYRLVSRRGTISGGVLYEARDGGFGEKVAVLFVGDPDDDEAVARFNQGNRLFAELGGGRGLARVLELSSRSARRAYVVMEWIAEGTLESRVAKRGPLDHPTLLEATGDLVTGLAKAHRAMPSVVHNHIHPGKVGFLSADEIVLFGYEWGAQVFEQDSNLADTFLEDADSASESKRAADVRRLGQSLAYAATGEWIAELSIGQQRERVRSLVQGPLATFLDRMLSAGKGGYASAVDAALDFGRLLRGDLGTWRARVLPKQQLQDASFGTTAWEDAEDDYFELDEADDEPVALSASDYEIAEDEHIAGLGVGHHHPPAPPRAATVDPRQAFAAAQARLQAQVEANKSDAGNAKAGRIIGIVMASMFGLSMCVATISEELADDHDYDYHPPDIPDIEPIPMPNRIEPEPAPIEPALPAMAPATLDSIFRYEGEVSGPENLEGLELGDKCTIWIEPNDSGLNCRWSIDCGKPKRRIYGGGDVGYSTCEINEDGYPTRASDEDDDAPDGAFIAELEGPAPMIMVFDRWLEPPTRAMIRITGAGYRHPGPVPEVRQAKRVAYEVVENRMAVDDWPSFASDASEAEGAAEIGSPGPEPQPIDEDLPEQLTKTDIRNVLTASSARFKRCLEPAVEVTVKITILPSGTVSEAGVVPDHRSGTEQCLVREARRLVFPRFSGESMTINWRVRG